MAITKDANRQYPLVAKVDITYDQLTDATAMEAIDVPAGAVVIGGWFDVTTAWDSATSDTLIVGDGDDTDRYCAGTTMDLTALGVYHFTLGDVVTVNAAIGHEYTAKDTIDVTWDGTGTAPTAGAGTLVVVYYVDGRGNENQD